MKQIDRTTYLAAISIFCAVAVLLTFQPHDALAKASTQDNARIITTPASGGGPQVRILDGSGTEITHFFAYPSSYRGEFQVAIGDVNGDGDNNIVVAPGAGFGPNVRVFTSGGNYIGQFNVYDSNFRGGVNIAVGDIDGDAVDEIITVPSSRGGSNVRIFGYRNGSFVPTTENFMAYNENFRGGVNITTGDIDNDGIDEIITAPKSQGGPNVRVFGKRGNEIKPTTPGIMAYHSAFRGGVTLTSCDVDGDGTEEIITGIQKDGAPHIRIFGVKEGEDAVSLLSPGFFAFDTSFRGGVNLACSDIDLDGNGDIIASIASKGKPIVRIFDKDGNQIEDDMFAFAESFLGGVNVASNKIYLKTTDKIIYAQGDGTDNNSNAILQSDKAKNYTLQTQFKLLDRDTTDAYTKFHTTYFGVYLRYEDNNNWIRVDFHESYRPADTFWVRLLIKEDGSYTPYFHEQEGFDIASLFTSWHQLMIVDTGQKVTVKIDNENVMTQTYSSDIKYGYKGYIANICTRALFDNLTFNSSENSDESFTVGFGADYGLDISRNRYASVSRCNLSSNPYTELAIQSNYSLPLTWTRGSGLWIVLNDDRPTLIQEREADTPETQTITEIQTPDEVVTTCLNITADCIDLDASIEEYEGILETGTGDSTAFGTCTAQDDNELMAITEAGQYELYLDWYNSAGKMVLAMLKPSQKYLGTWHGQFTDETIDLGWLNVGDHLVLGNAAFWHSMAFGPFDSSDTTTYNITQLSSTSWNINMDEGVHFDGNFNDAHIIIRKVGGICPATGEEVVISEDEEREVVVNKLIYAQGDGTDNNLNAIIKPEASSSYSLSTTFKLLDKIDTDAYTRFHSSYFGVYLRYEDVRNWVRVDFLTAYRPAGKLYVRLLKRENGSFISVKAIPIEGYDFTNLFTYWHDLSIVDTGTAVTVNLDGEEVLKTTYSTTVKTGMKGYLSNIATRSVWENMSVITNVTASSPATATLDTTSTYKYGLDISSLRYNSDDRYDIAENVLHSLMGNASYALPTGWDVGDGLWFYKDAAYFVD